MRPFEMLLTIQILHGCTNKAASASRTGDGYRVLLPGLPQQSASDLGVYRTDTDFLMDLEAEGLTGKCTQGWLP